MYKTLLAKLYFYIFITLIPISTPKSALYVCSLYILIFFQMEVHFVRWETKNDVVQRRMSDFDASSRWQFTWVESDESEMRWKWDKLTNFFSNPYLAPNNDKFFIKKL